MPVFTGSPHGGHASEDFLGIDAISAFSDRIGVALQHHERGGASRMCRREHGARRERAVHPFSAYRVSENIAEV